MRILHPAMIEASHKYHGGTRRSAWHEAEPPISAKLNSGGDTYQPRIAQHTLSGLDCCRERPHPTPPTLALAFNRNTAAMLFFPSLQPILPEYARHVEGASSIRFAQPS